ncbi:two-component system sensor histidine kinase NtrB [Candidatus Nitrosotenuis cloacae]|uniref:two-component system sensor histidine kinase NtrB n=1 Tax=Candidatus Nitrosotenuis cloacae TaxID=1603555 RepID=UPI00227FEBD3|nr:ATP-binding protein [Candidatus Nitrosotenuis cloacae]
MYGIDHTTQQMPVKFGLYHVQLMRYYDEVLAQSARNYAFTADKKWVMRYRTIEPLSDKLLKDAIKAADDSTRPFFVTLDKANAALVAMEHRSIRLVRRGKKEEALGLLDGMEYEKQRKILAGGLADFVAKMEGAKTKHEIAANIAIPSVQDVMDLERKLAVIEESVKKERLVAIGELAARFAHDIRNPLAVIRNSIDLLTSQNPDPKTIDHYQRIQRAVTRITYQIDDVLNFVKPRILIPKQITLFEILNSTVSKVKIPDTVRLEMPKKDIVFVADPINLEIVFVNLITNAIQAMNNSGKIRIGYKVEKKNIVISLSDSGPGIPKKYLSKIFEPLFTTKQTGTGLGLVSCKTIVEQHGGKISVQSRTGSGTTFFINLPKKRMPARR